MANVAGKMRKLDNPYASWAYGEWEFRLLKAWQAKQDKPYARWFMGVKSPMTYGKWELGDGYVAEYLPGLNVGIRSYDDVTIDTSVWETVGQFMAWAFSEN